MSDTCSKIEATDARCGEKLALGERARVLRTDAQRAED